MLRHDGLAVALSPAPTHDDDNDEDDALLGQMAALGSRMLLLLPAAGEEEMLDAAVQMQRVAQACTAASAT